MREYDFENEEKKEKLAGIVQIVGLTAAILLCLGFLFFVVFKKDKNAQVGGGAAQGAVGSQEAGMSGGAGTGAFVGTQAGSPGGIDGMTGDPGEADAGDPQGAFAGNMGDEDGAGVELSEILSASTVEETEEISYGIDVARYQGTIDWEKVAQSGVDFAMIRVGYRTMDTGEIAPDTNAKYNMQEASANGIQIGAYFFSTAITREEAIEEAEWVAEYVSRYPITYPIAYNCEGFDRADSRQRELSRQERSAIAAAFLERIYELGYTPMFYAARDELAANAKWDKDELEKHYKIWVAQYPAVIRENRPDYGASYAMWQYTNKGSVPGISQSVDMNIAYFGYAATEQAKNEEAPEEAKADPEALMNFTQVEETVTAKDAVNLRNVPSQGGSSIIVHTLQNGETAKRTGVSDSGWSRVIYDGQTLYAVSNYLTTDLTVHTPEPDDGIKTKFQDCSDSVTAKIEVNLRTLPSVTNPDSQVIAVLKNGEYVTRTGINTDYGWSRVEYNGQVLYCISSYLIAEGQ